MTQKQYNELFNKAKSFYNAHKHEPKITAVPNYSNFKIICDALIASDYNDITISVNPNDKYQHYKQLNQLFTNNQVTEIKDLLSLDL